MSSDLHALSSFSAVMKMAFPTISKLSIFNEENRLSRNKSSL